MSTKYKYHDPDGIYFISTAVVYPVESGWVNEPQEYYYSSARNYAGMESPIKIISLYDGDVI
jgi:hypothetical protein